MKKRLPILLLLAAAGGYYYYTQNQKESNSGKLQVSGNLELTQVDLSFKTAGRIVELTVREGDWVKKGQVIARLDASQLDQQKARDLAAVAGAQSAREQLQTAIEYQQATIDSDIAVRRAELAQAQARLDDLLAGSRAQEIAQAQAVVTDAKAASELAKAELERARTLFSREDISRSQFDQAQTRVDSTTAQLRASEQRLALVQEGRSHAEIAVVLATSVAAVKARLHRAREHLRKHYQPEHET